MTEAGWWQRYLRSWSSTLGIPLQEKVYTAPETRRKLGDWWRNGGDWCLHLDNQHYAQFSSEDIHEDLRRSLSWSFQTLAGPEDLDWRPQLLHLLEQFSTKSVQDLYSSFSDLLGSSVQEPFLDIDGLPGYLVWLHFANRYESQLKYGDWQAEVAQVVDAVIPGGFIGWTKPDKGEFSAFVLCPVAVLVEWREEARERENGPTVAVEPTGSPGSTGALGMSPVTSGSSTFAQGDPAAPDLEIEGGDGGVLRQVLLELLQNIEVDAYVLAHAAVSYRMSDASQLGIGIATMTAAWQARQWRTASEKVTLWAEQRLLSLLQAVPRPVIELFLRTDAHFDRHLPDREARLPGELLEVLQGVMKANLNVSEAARLLYLHRNTLLHRIERIRQLTGYDIRNFEDALTLWLIELLNRRCG